MKTYIQLILLTFTIGIVCYFVKLHSFPWGEVQVLSNGATFNDLWYYNFNNFSTASFCASFAYLTSVFMDMYKDSRLCWIIKYSSIAFALILIINAVCHIITYNRISIVEMAVDLCSIIYVIYRALLWYTKYMHHEQYPTRYPLENY